MPPLFPVCVNTPFRKDADDLALPQDAEHGPHSSKIVGASAHGYVVEGSAQPPKVPALIDLAGGEEDDRAPGCGGQHHRIAERRVIGYQQHRATLRQGRRKLGSDLIYDVAEEAVQAIQQSVGDPRGSASHGRSNSPGGIRFLAGYCTNSRDDQNRAPFVRAWHLSYETRPVRMANKGAPGLGHEKQLKITSRHLFTCLGDIFTHLVQLRHFCVGLRPYLEQLRVDIDRASPIAALGSSPGSTEQ